MFVSRFMLVYRDAPSVAHLTGAYLQWHFYTVAEAHLVTRPEGINFNRHIAVIDICKSMQNSFPYSGSELWGSCSDVRLNDSVIVSNALLLSKCQRKEAADDLRSVLRSLFSVRKEQSQRKLIQFPVLLQDVNETLMQMVTFQLEILYKIVYDWKIWDLLSTFCFCYSRLF